MHNISRALEWLVWDQQKQKTHLVVVLSPCQSQDILFQVSTIWNKTKALSQWQLLKGKGLILLYELKTHELQHVNRKTSSFSAFSNVQSYTKCSFPVTRTSLAIIAYIPWFASGHVLPKSPGLQNAYFGIKWISMEKLITLKHRLHCGVC